jgi:hypothetical protein
VLSATPASLGAGESFSVEVSFEPSSAGAQQGVFTVDRRRIPLAGAGVEPPLPQPQIVLERESDRLARLQVRLNSAARASGEGRVELSLRPFADGAGEPALLFPAVNNRAATFQFTRGDSIARFTSGDWIELQLGTTAGTIQATAIIGGSADQAVLVIAPACVGIESTKAIRLASSLEVTITGYDNSRSTGKLTFTFSDRAGKNIIVPVDATRDFQSFFDSSTVGGVFKLRAVFPVTGNPAEIQSVQTEFANVAGSSTARREFE